MVTLHSFTAAGTGKYFQAHANDPQGFRFGNTKDTVLTG